MSLQRGLTGASEGGQVGGIYGAAGGFIDGLFNGPIYKSINGMNGGVSVGTLKPDSIGTTFADFGDQSQYFPMLSGISSSLNQAYKNQISATSPDFFDTLNQVGKNLNSAAKGVLPADVMGNIYRSVGYSGLQFAGGPQIQGNEARQLGLTSVQRQDAAAGALPGYENLLSSLNPVSPINFIFTPQSIQQRSDQIKALNQHLTTEQSMINYGISQQNQQQDMAYLSYINTLFGGRNNTSNTGMGSGYFGQDQSQFGGLMGIFSNMFGSMGGGGASIPSTDPAYNSMGGI